MEDIVANIAYFTPAEQELLGLREPQTIDSLDLSVHFERVNDRRAFVQLKLEAAKDEVIEGDYERYEANQTEIEARKEELFQLDWDEATLMNIEIDLAPTRAMLSDVIFDRMLNEGDEQL